jgi:hypothetical protein
MRHVGALVGAVMALSMTNASLVHAQDVGVRGDALNAAWRAKGITVHAPADQPVVLMSIKDVYGGAAVTSQNLGLVLVQQGGHPCQYTMEFDQPLVSLAFSRARLLAGPSGVTHPVWTATALDSSGRVLSTVGEARIASYSDVPASSLMLRGPGIKQVVFWGDDRGVDGFCNVVLDTLIVTTPS